MLVTKKTQMNQTILSKLQIGVYCVVIVICCFSRCIEAVGKKCFPPPQTNFLGKH